MRRSTITILLAALALVAAVLFFISTGSSPKGAAPTGFVPTSPTAVNAPIPAEQGHPAVAASPPPTAPEYDPSSVIVTFKTAPTATVLSRFASAHGLSTPQLHRQAIATLYTMAIPATQTVDGLTAELRGDPAVASVDRSYFSYPVGYAVPPNDPGYTDSTTWSENGVNYVDAKSWWLRDTGVNTFWNDYNNSVSSFPVRATSDVVKVAVLDTGFWMNHPDRGANIVGATDECATYAGGAVTTDTVVTPLPLSTPDITEEEDSHGTCTAGEVAAATNNGLGVASVGYDLQVRVYKVQGVWTDGNPPGSWVIPDIAVTNGIYDATNDGCKVISISLGGPDFDRAEQDAVNYAYAHGVVICAATGNDATSTPSYPGAYTNVIGVGAYGLDSSRARMRSSFSNYGSQLDILAPGQMVWGLTDPSYTAPQSVAGYEWWDGSSMATPAFAAELAMLWRFAPALSNAQIASCMLTNADAAGAGQPNTNFGWGYVDIIKAYAQLKASYPYLAAPTLITTKTAYATGSVNIAWGITTTPTTGVSYRVSLDGGAAATQTATTASYSGLAEATHAVAIASVSSYNWYNPASDTTTFTFVVDETRPHTTSDAVSTYTGTATISLTATDALSGVAATYYRLDGGATTTYTAPVTIAPPASGAASHAMSFWSMDRAGNVETSTTANFTVDAAAGFYTLSYLAGASGSIVGSATQVLAAGASGTAVTATPTAGYHFVNWSDGSTANPRTDTNVAADHTFSATFAADSVNAYTLSYVAGANGSIVGSATQVVAVGASGTVVTATPAAGYHFVSWSDGILAATRTDTNVTADLTFTAAFAAPLATKLTITANHTTIYRHHTVSFSGTISPNMPDGTHVIVEIRKSGSKTWYTLSTRSTYGSKWSYGYTPSTRHGTFYVRVRYAGSTVYVPASAWRKLIIK
jgi:hypothetical protein